MWSPIDGPLIRLWKANLDSSPKLPIGVPSLAIYCPIWGNDTSRLVEKEKFISFGLQIHGFLEGGHYTKFHI